jgi:uncharacterized membrane protein YgaE (UPF0421/DUF939 family)
MPFSSDAKYSGMLLFKNIEFERIIHSIKTAFACLIGMIILKVVGMPFDQWLMITIVVVMCAQINVGSVITKSYMRFLGTLTGSLLAALTIIFFGTESAPTAIVIALSAMLFSFIATSDKNYSDSGSLGAVTVIVILIGQHPTIITATHRCMEISVGILIAALVSQFFLPIRARDHLRRTQALTLEQLRGYYVSTLMTEPTESAVKSYRELDEAIVKLLSSQRSLAKESKREPFGTAFDSKQFNQILRCEKEVFRSIVCMHYAYDMLPGGRQILANQPAVQAFHKSMCLALENIAYCTQQMDFTHTRVTIPSLQPLKDSLQHINETIEGDDTVYINGFLFCAEILIVHLTELVILLSRGHILSAANPT